MTLTVFVTAQQLLDHLKLPEITAGSPPMPVTDTDLALKLAAAVQTVCDYIADKQPADPAWIAEIESWGTGSPAIEAPALVVLAVLEQAAEFYRFRGDDVSSETQDATDGFLSPGIANLLSGYRRPTFA